jgi:hypothetical protein
MKTLLALLAAVALLDCGPTKEQLACHEKEMQGSPMAAVCADYFCYGTHKGDCDWAVCESGSPSGCIALQADYAAALQAQSEADYDYQQQLNRTSNYLNSQRIQGQLLQQQIDQNTNTMMLQNQLEQQQIERLVH